MADNNFFNIIEPNFIQIRFHNYNNTPGSTSKYHFLEAFGKDCFSNISDFSETSQLKTHLEITYLMVFITTNHIFGMPKIGQKVRKTF